MSLRIITYDLRQPGRDYSGLYEAMKSIGATRCHPLGSVWLVRTGSSNAAVRDTILPHLDANDGLFVATMGPDWAAFGLASQDVQWLRQSA